MGFTTTATVIARTLEATLRRRFNLSLRPYKLLLELTSNCNSKCVTCAIWKNPASKVREDMTLAQIEQMFQAMNRDLVWLALSGGEVTLRKDFREIVAAAKRHCPNLKLVTFTTNGLKPDVALAYALAVRALGADCFITVSLDGDEETHDRLRGVPGNYRLAQRTWSLLREHGIRAHFGLTVGEGNEAFIRESFRSMRRDIKAVTFVHSEGIYGQCNPNSDESILRSLATIHRNYLVTSCDEFLERLYIKIGLRFLRHGRQRNVVPCSVGHTSLHVHPDGSVAHCMFMPAIGSIKQTPSLRTLVNGEASRKQLDTIAREQCPRCWMNCYAPHSMLMHPLHTVAASSNLLSALVRFFDGSRADRARAKSDAATTGKSREGRPDNVRNSIADFDATGAATAAAPLRGHAPRSQSNVRVEQSRREVIRLPLFTYSNPGAIAPTESTTQHCGAADPNTTALQ